MTFLTGILHLHMRHQLLDCDLQAIRKRHSTTDEALRVAEDMAAACTVLTHFSSRYPKVGISIVLRALQSREAHI